MRTIIYYFTRTGTTKKASQELAKKLEADLEEIVDEKDWSGPIGWLSAGRAAMRKKTTRIREHQKDPGNYDLVILATPVWAGTMASAIRTFAANHKQYFRNVAYMTTQGGPKRQRVFKDLADLCGQEPVAELMLTTKEVRDNEAAAKIEEFASQIRP